MEKIIGGEEYWFGQHKGSVHNKLFTTVEYLDKNQNYQRLKNLRNYSIYEGRYVASFTGFSDAFFNLNLDDNESLKWNVCKAIIDTALAHIGAERASPMFLTKKGNFKEQQNAKALTKLSEGEFYRHQQYHIGRRVAQNAFTLGTGVQKICPGEDKNIISQSIFPDELLVDEREARSRNGKVSVTYHVKECSRYAVANQYRKQADQILTSGRLTRHEENGYGEKYTDTISVIEAWFIPPWEGVGRHVICTNKIDLVDEVYDRDDFPLVYFRAGQPLRGFYGTSFIDPIIDIQNELDFILNKIQSLANLSTVQVLVPRGSGISQMTNEDFAYVEYSGGQPTFVTPPPLVREFIDYANYLYDKAFELSGVSQMHATAQKPSGLNSGTAQRMYHDISSLRFKHLEQEFAKYYMDATKRYVMSAQEIEKTQGGYEIRSGGDNEFGEFDLQGVDIEDDVYQLQVFPTSFLPKEPTGKIEMINEISQHNPELYEQLIRTLDFPDIEGALSYVNAEADNLDDMLTAIIYRGEYRNPEPFMNLPMVINRARQAYLRAKTDKVPEERLEMLRQFIKEAAQYMPSPEEQQPQPQALPEAPPDGLMAPTGGAPVPGV